MLLLRLGDHQTLLRRLFGAYGFFRWRSLCTGRASRRAFWASGSSINGFAYVIMSLTGLLLPQYQNKVFLFSQPALFGEMALMLWLVIKGAQPQPLDAAASPVH